MSDEIESEVDRGIDSEDEIRRLEILLARCAYNSSVILNFLRSANHDNLKGTLTMLNKFADDVWVDTKEFASRAGPRWAKAVKHDGVEAVFQYQEGEDPYAS